MEPIIEHCLMFLILLILIACTEAISRPRVVSVVVGIEDASTKHASTEHVSDASFESGDDSFVSPVRGGTYKHVTGIGDQDACHGMRVDSVYGYYITDTFLGVVKCFRNTPDSSLAK